MSSQGLQNYNPRSGGDSISKPEVKPVLSTGSDSSKPKPCCVCKNEKSKRDECMLFSKAADPALDCKTTIDQYRSCMAGFGFQV
ncbi:cytochrome C oxidase copper chaperone-domain-containing protein [Hypomontagnella monticulosa]|nr:cytochrome C oxidase copper chaperone-domain-containing protein [Hypomontagnella monticulosa]